MSNQNDPNRNLQPLPPTVEVALIILCIILAVLATLVALIFPDALQTFIENLSGVGTPLP